MSKKYASLFLGALFLVVAVAAPSFAGGARVGDPIPEFTVEMLDGTSVNSVEAAKKHKTMIVTFIQTACSTCRAEILALQGLVNKTGKDVYVLPISVDMRGGVEFLNTYKAENKVDFNFGLDPKFTVPRLFRMSFTPGSAVIEGGKVVAIHKGYDEEIKAELEKVFN